MKYKVVSFKYANKERMAVFGVGRYQKIEAENACNLLTKGLRTYEDYDWSDVNEYIEEDDVEIWGVVIDKTPTFNQWGEYAL